MLVGLRSSLDRLKSHEAHLSNRVVGEHGGVQSHHRPSGSRHDFSQDELTVLGPDLGVRVALGQSPGVQLSCWTKGTSIGCRMTNSQPGGQRSSRTSPRQSRGAEPALHQMRPRPQRGPCAFGCYTRCYETITGVALSMDDTCLTCTNTVGTTGFQPATP